MGTHPDKTRSAQSKPLTLDGVDVGLGAPRYAALLQQWPITLLTGGGFHSRIRAAPFLQRPGGQHRKAITFCQGQSG